jgi:hypothetical protein
MPARTRVQIRAKRAGTDIMLADYKKMRAAHGKKPNLTEWEQAVETLYELLLYRQTTQMTRADAILIEAAANAHRQQPAPVTLPYYI